LIQLELLGLNVTSGSTAVHSKSDNDKNDLLLEQLHLGRAALEIIVQHGLTEELKKKVKSDGNQTAPGTDGIDYPREGPATI
jgi:hypothetical protein